MPSMHNSSCFVCLFVGLLYFDRVYLSRPCVSTVRIFIIQLHTIEACEREAKRKRMKQVHAIYLYSVSYINGNKSFELKVQRIGNEKSEIKIAHNV